MKVTCSGLAASCIGAIVLCSEGFATTLPGTQSLPNGDFEQGPVIWDTVGDALIERGGGYTWAAILGFPCDGPGINCLGYIGQEVAVPAELPELGFRIVIFSDDIAGTGTDTLKVLVDGFWTPKTIALKQANETDGYELRVADLSGWAGDLVLLGFTIQTDGADASYVALDEIFFAPAGYIFSDGFEEGFLPGFWSELQE